jgi:hypothetical protein
LLGNNDDVDDGDDDDDAKTSDEFTVPGSELSRVVLQQSERFISNMYVFIFRDNVVVVSPKIVRESVFHFHASQQDHFF